MLKSEDLVESAKLTVDQYLYKFSNPHSIISKEGNKEQYQDHRNIIEQILARSYNDSQQLVDFKQKIIQQLTFIVNSWIKQHSPKCRQSMGQYGLKVFGSFSLRANSHDGDIDMICLVPQEITDNHFFQSLAQILKKKQHMASILPIRDALIPLIKLTIYGIQIDLLISKISREYLTKNPNCLYTKNKLTGIPEKQLRNINGYRTSFYLKKNVPNFENFQVALKAIKLWAKNKNIYSQIYGYLGGAGYSIMLAKIVQLYPNYSVLQLLQRFFFIYSFWSWSIPIKIEDVGNQQQIGLSAVIYTPLYPHMNAAHSTSRTNLSIISKQLRKGYRIIKKILKNEKKWDDLFYTSDFFSQYRNSLKISIMANGDDDFLIWKGNVESKFRKLIRMLQNQMEYIPLIQFHPNPFDFDGIHPNYKHCKHYFIGFNINPNSPINDSIEIDLVGPVRNFIQMLQPFSKSKSLAEVNVGVTFGLSQQMVKNIQTQQQNFKNNK